MNTDRELMQQLLEALEAIAWSNNTTWQSQRAKIEVDAIREALAEQPAQQEPVAQEWRYYFSHSGATGKPDEVVGPCFTDRKEVAFGVGCFDQTALYPPAQRKPLTMQERTSIVRANTSFHDKNEIDAYGIIDDVEAAHGIKENT